MTLEEIITKDGVPLSKITWDSLYLLTDNGPLGGFGWEAVFGYSGGRDPDIRISIFTGGPANKPVAVYSKDWQCLYSTGKACRLAWAAILRSRAESIENETKV